MTLATLRITSEIWLYQGISGWHFVTLPKQYAEKIQTVSKHTSKGWGTVPVTVKLNGTEWKTSLFPDKKSGSYLLPMKSEMRKKLHLNKGDIISFTLQL